MYRSIFVSIFGLSLIGFQTTTFAVDVAYDGYFRTRGNFHYNLDLDNGTGPKSRAYTDFRFRVNPTFFVTDKFRVYTSLNFLNGNLGGSPDRIGTFSNPAQSHDRSLDYNQAEGTIGRPDSDTSSLSNGGIYLPEGSVQSTGFEPIQLRRAWVEMDIPYGTLKVGRMPHHLGLGIYANAGDDADQEVGTTRDRIVFDTNFGPYYARPGIGWLVEGKLDEPSDDFIEYFFTFGRKSESQDVSIFMSYNSQNRYSPEASETTGNLSGRGSGYWAFDFFASNRFNLLTVEAEVALFSGKVMGRDLLAINAVARSSYDLKPLEILFEAGYSSGTSNSEQAAGDIKTVAFSRDYNVSLIVFEEALPSGRALPNAPHSGAISNAIYPRLKLTYDMAEFFKPALNIIAPFAAKIPAGSDGRFYGIEYDILTYWPVNRYLTGELSFGHFIPGSFYEQVSNANSTFLVRGGMTAKF